jgi:hypothetical protein
MKTIIASTHCTRTDFIEIQYKTLKKFIKNDYEFVVFNDAKEYPDIYNFNNPSIKNDIINCCNNLGIKCINVPQHLHKQRNILFPNTIEPSSDHPSCRTSIAIQYLYNWANEYGYDYLIIIDADMFLMDYLDINDYNNIDIAYVQHSRSNSGISVNYIWNAFIILNNKNIKNFDKLNFDCGRINGLGVDTGGQTHFWLEKYSDQIKTKIIGCGHMGLWKDFEPDIKYYSEKLKQYFENLAKINNNLLNKEILLNKTIIHIRSSGGNWDINNTSFINYYKEKHGEYRNDELVGKEWKNYQYMLAKVIYDFVESIII